MSERALRQCRATDKSCRKFQLRVPGGQRRSEVGEGRAVDGQPATKGH